MFWVGRRQRLALGSKALVLASWSVRARSSRLRRWWSRTRPYVDLRHSPLDRSSPAWPRRSAILPRGRRARAPLKNSTVAALHQVIEGELRCHCWLTHSSIASSPARRRVLSHLRACTRVNSISRWRAAWRAWRRSARGLVCGSQLGSVHAFGPGPRTTLYVIRAELRRVHLDVARHLPHE